MLCLYSDVFVLKTTDENQNANIDCNYAKIESELLSVLKSFMILKNLQDFIYSI